MDSLTPTLLPSLDLINRRRALERGTDEWRRSCDEVRSALENHGCLVVHYDEIVDDLRDDMLEAMQSLFELPVEVKQRNETPGPYLTYGSGQDPCYETLAVINPSVAGNAAAFTATIWPEGNDEFCFTLSSMSKKMLELNLLILNMIFDAYGVGKYFESEVENMDALFRMTKYSSPNVAAGGLSAHSDSNLLTLLSQNKVEGLLIKSKHGEWSQAKMAQGSHVVIVGEALEAWSNGRLFAPVHKVMINKGEERLSCGLFTMPKRDAILKSPLEFIDEMHPQVYKPFSFIDYLHFASANANSDNDRNIDAFARI